MRNINEIAGILGGNVAGPDRVVCPGPGHSAGDRSLSIKFDPTDPSKFICHSFSGDDWSTCRDWVRERLGLSDRKLAEPIVRPSRPTAKASTDNQKAALNIWDQCRDPRDTIAQTYLECRGLTLADNVAGRVIRYHPGLLYEGNPTPGMVTLWRDIHSDAPRAIQRTFLRSDGTKICRKSLGPTSGAAIKLSADDEVEQGLAIGEGLESCMAGVLLGFKPIWSVGSFSMIAQFPVLGGVECLSILGETDDNGKNAGAIEACAGRWAAASKEVISATPKIYGDMNDVVVGGAS